MCSNLMPRLLPVLLLITTSLGAEKQIKLEDIEKDNLRADQDAKYEKQFPSQQFPQQQLFPQYSSAAYQQAAATPSSYPSPYNYQSYQPAYQQYQTQPQQHQQQVSPYQSLLYQQYLQPSLYQQQSAGFPQLSGNSIAGAGSTGAHPLQAYLTQLSQVPSAQASPQQQAAYVMAYATPAALAAYQQQAAAYYQPGAGSLQAFMSAAAGQGGSLYYPQQQSAQSPSLQQYDFSQHYVPPFQPVGPGKIPSSSYPQPAPNSVSFPSVYATASPLTSSQIYTGTPEPPTFSSIKTSSQPSSAASFGQQQQYLQAFTASTPSPLQSKYQNSPQYLAQNYNTIHSSYLTPKSAYAGVKATAIPPFKVASQGGFIPTNPASSANYQQYRSISG